MCIIIAKKTGIIYDKEIIEKNVSNAWDNNPDGAGIAFKKKNEDKILITKGIFSLDKLLVVLKTLDIEKEDELIIHLRISTSGLVDKRNTHPFVITNDLEEITDFQVQYVKKPILAHNGIFSKFTRTQSIYNDTVWFIKDFLSFKYINLFLQEDIKNFEFLFSAILGDNKLALLYPDNDMQIVNKDTFIEENGILYSNGSFRKYNRFNWEGYSRSKRKIKNYKKKIGFDTNQEKINNRYPESLLDNISDKIKKEGGISDLILVGKKNAVDIEGIVYMITEVKEKSNTASLLNLSGPNDDLWRTFGWINQFCNIYNGKEYIEYLKTKEKITCPI